MGQFLPHTPTNQLGHDPLKHRVLFFSLSLTYLFCIFSFDFAVLAEIFRRFVRDPAQRTQLLFAFAVSGSHNLCHKARRTWRTWRTQLGWGLQWHRRHWPHDISHRNIANSGNNREVTIRVGALSWEWWEGGRVSYWWREFPPSLGGRSLQLMAASPKSITRPTDGLRTHAAMQKCARVQLNHHCVLLQIDPILTKHLNPLSTCVSFDNFS